MNYILCATTKSISLWWKGYTWRLFSAVERTGATHNSLCHHSFVAWHRSICTLKSKFSPAHVRTPVRDIKRAHNQRGGLSYSAACTWNLRHSFRSGTLSVIPFSRSSLVVTSCRSVSACPPFCRVERRSAHC